MKGDNDARSRGGHPHPAVDAVIKGSLTASVRNPSSRIHWGAVVIGGMRKPCGAQYCHSSLTATGPLIVPNRCPERPLSDR